MVVGVNDMPKLIQTITADVLRYQLGGLLAVAVGVADLFFGQRLGAGVDGSLVVGGLAALGVHLADSPYPLRLPSPPATKL